MIAAGTRRGPALAAVIASNFMIAIEATIVSTAMPEIVGQLGGLQLYSWVFSAFLLTQTATTVVFGKLSDRIGRKTVMLWGLGVFLFGSLLCGLAWSLPSLIVFRLVQGVGAGAVQPTGMTIVGDLYSAHERGRIQGYLASVWALSAVLGRSPAVSSSSIFRGRGSFGSTCRSASSLRACFSAISTKRSSAGTGASII